MGPVSAFSLRSLKRVHHIGGARLWAGSCELSQSWQQVSQAQARPLTRTHASATDGAVAGAPRVVILGGGFGGLYTAVRLSSLFWPRGKKPQVTMVDQSERFVFKPLLYELLNNTASDNEVAPGFSQLLAPYPVRFVQAKVVGAFPEEVLKDGGSATGGVVKLEGGNELPYDWLVVALGAQTDARGVPGVIDHAVPFNTLEDAIKVREALNSIEARGAEGRTGNVMVVGAGYAGVELACVIAERIKDKGMAGRVTVSLVTPGQHILDGAGPGQRQAAEQVLAKLGVEVITGTRVRSVAASASTNPLPTSAIVNLDDRPTLMETAKTTAANMAESAAGMADAAAAAAAAAAASLRQASGGAADSQDAVVKSSTADAGADAGVDASPAKVPVGSGPKIEVEYEGAQQVPVDLVLWTAGSAPVTKQARKGFPFPTTDRGSVKTDPTLRVQSHTKVFALGDVCVSTQGYSSDDAADGQGQQLPATAQVAFQQADYVAWNVWAGMMGRPLLPFRYQHLGSMMSLGSFNAAVDLPVPVPEVIQSTVQSSPLGPLLNTLGVKLSPPAASEVNGGVTLEGPLAALIRRAAYLYRQPTGEQRVNVATEWASQVSGLASYVLERVAQNSGAR